ncbi:MAG TPA: DUF2752 domain-containing protein [Acidimicrobiia bacterium]|nr:DUF2752 domain-containing protein [Acidimicrobiia bacterium]
MIPQTQTRSFREFRLLAAGMIAAGAVWPLLPIHPPLLCPLRSATGIPCPFCGMTRSVVALLHGDVVASLRFNPGGIFIVALAIVLLAGPSWLKAINARYHPSVWLLVPVFVALWAYNIGWNPTFN